MTTITSEKKQEYADRYFGGCKSKELKEIDYETPSNHNVKALICRKPNRYLGSLLLLKVDDEPVEQFVQGMPKIHYLDNYHMLKSHGIGGYMEVYEKLDGTNICLYALKNAEGEVLEVVPKSRNMGTLDKEFLDKYVQCDTYVFEEFVRKHPEYTLYLELYGMGNLHMIKHFNTYLDVKYLGAYTGEEFLKLGNPFPTRQPRSLFRIHNIENVVEEEKFYVNTEGIQNLYRGYIVTHGCRCLNMEECISYMKDVMEELNKSYEKVNHRLAIEGVVINGINMKDEFTFIKVKPDTIELAHKSENGIPRQYIMKEIMKYLDENRSIAKDTWRDNPDEVMEYLNRNLRESFEQVYIDKSQGKIKRLFEERINPAPTPEEIIRIGDELMEEYPDKSIQDLMRVFGQNYPDMKKSGGKLYKYLEDKNQ